MQTKMALFPPKRITEQRSYRSFSIHAAYSQGSQCEQYFTMLSRGGSAPRGYFRAGGPDIKKPSHQPKTRVMIF